MNRPEPMRFPPGYPELLEHIGQLIYRDLIERGVHPKIAEDLALQVGDSICAEVGAVRVVIGMRTNFMPAASTSRCSAAGPSACRSITVFTPSAARLA